jgi:hypothetical protein
MYRKNAFLTVRLPVTVQSTVLPCTAAGRSQL